MKIFDNVTNIVRDDMEKTIKRNSKVSVAAACFSMYAYSELKKQLESIDEFRFIFTSPTFVTEKAKKQKREEEKTVFYLICEDCLAVRKRESRGLLAGLWELPNVEGKLDAEQALCYVEDAGCEPAELLKSVERVHVFTHIIWRMRCYYMVCRRKSPEFVWADAQRRRADVALPTAFRMFVEE